MQYCPPVLFKTVSEVSRGHLASARFSIAQIIMNKLSLDFVVSLYKRSDKQ